MKFSPAFLEEIKARLPPSEVVGRRVRLKKSGREWSGLSPFNAEKTPSFFVNDQKMAWFDFSSQRNGNIFDFVMATEGVSFPEAVERLAREAGLALPAASPESEARERQRAGLQEVLELAAVYFEAVLQSREGAAARGYLAGRGLSAATQTEFRLGFAPDQKFALRDHLAGKGAAVETMIEAGLLIHGDDIQVPYDRFRGRVMFPICDRVGKVIAFGGRALDKNVPAKYLNSPETPLFHKGSILYNHHRARKAAHDTGDVIAVEGYVDVIAMASAGFAQTVAPLGTALTADQCELLWKMAPEPILCFDGDRAGRKAAYRAIDTALPLIGPERSLRFALLPEGQDPDDLVRQAGPSAVGEVLAGARSLVDLFWTRETEASPIDTPERRAGLERRLSDKLKEIADEAVRRHYRAEFEKRLGELLGRSHRPPGGGNRQQAPGNRPWTARQPATGYSRPAPAPRRLGVASDPPLISPGLLQSRAVRRARDLPMREAHILLIALNHPGLLQRHAEALCEIEFESPELGRLRDALLASVAEAIEETAALRAAIETAGLGEVLLRVEAAAAVLSLGCVRVEAAEEDAAATLLQAMTLHHKTRSLNRELKSAELVYAADGSEASFERLRQIRAEISAVEGIEASAEGGDAGFASMNRNA
jgi:DNA primase